MTAPVAVLFVFVTHGAVQAPAADVVTACLQALPAGTRATTRTAAEAPADAALLAEARAGAAVAAVVVSWTDAALRQADVRAAVGLPDRPRWVTRTVTFAAGDQLAERARALGLVIASVVEEGLEPVVSPGPPPPPRAPPAAVAETPAAPIPVAPADDVGPWAVEAGVTTAFESGTDGDDVIGGTIALRRWLPGRLAPRAGLAFRLTDRDIPITSRSFSGSLGLGWASARFGRPHAFGLGARLDLLIMRKSVRVSQEQPLTASEQAFWSGALDLLAEVGVGLSRATTFLGGLGVEERFTEARVLVPGRIDATLPRERLILELGILSRF